MKKVLILLLLFIVSCTSITKAPKLKREEVYRISQQHIEKKYGEYVPIDKMGFYRKGMRRPWYVNIYGENALYLLDIAEDGQILKSKKVVDYTPNSIYKR